MVLKRVNDLDNGSAFKRPRTRVRWIFGRLDMNTMFRLAGPLHLRRSFGFKSTKVLQDVIFRTMSHGLRARSVVVKINVWTGRCVNDHSSTWVLVWHGSELKNTRECDSPWAYFLFVILWGGSTRWGGEVEGM